MEIEVTKSRRWEINKQIFHFARGQILRVGVDLDVPDKTAGDMIRDGYAKVPNAMPKIETKEADDTEPIGIIKKTGAKQSKKAMRSSKK